MDVRAACTFESGIMDGNEVIVPSASISLSGLPSKLPMYITKDQLTEWLQRNLGAILVTIVDCDTEYNGIDNYLWRLNALYRTKVSEIAEEENDEDEEVIFNEEDSVC